MARGRGSQPDEFDMKDWISLIESAYDLDGSTEHWLSGLVHSAIPMLDEGGGVTAQILSNSIAGFSVESVVVGGDGATVSHVEQAISTAHPESIERAYRSGITAATLSEVVFSHVPGAEDTFARATDGQFADSLGIVAYTGLDKVVALNTPLRLPRTMTPRERQLWMRAATHVGTGLRLRHALSGADSVEERVEAVLAPDAKVHHAQGTASRDSVLQKLRRAVLGMEKARGRLRREDPDQALSLWEGLVSGRWSLVDRFDSDGRRFIVAVRNDPELGDPRGLTLRELQVAELIGLARPAKEIGYILGISDSAVNNVVSRVRKKLGLNSRSDVAAFFAPDGLRARLVRLDLARQPLMAGSYGEVQAANMEGLTTAEQEVSMLLVQGASNRSIARTRHTSEHTVANQIKAIFAKLGVTNRAGLAARLTRSG